MHIHGARRSCLNEDRTVEGVREKLISQKLSIVAKLFSSEGAWGQEQGYPGRAVFPDVTEVRPKSLGVEQQLGTPVAAVGGP